jgi:VanZ family protein
MEQPRRGVRWGVAVAYGLLLFVLSSIPSREMPVGMPLHADKIAHAVAYAILALLFCRALRSPTAKALVLTAALCTAYGILNEMQQSLIPGREASGWDALANTIGASAATALWAKLSIGRPTPS